MLLKVNLGANIYSAVCKIVSYIICIIYVSSLIYIFKFEVTQDYKTENTFQKKYLEKKSYRKVFSLTAFVFQIILHNCG